MSHQTWLQGQHRVAFVTPEQSQPRLKYQLLVYFTILRCKLQVSVAAKERNVGQTTRGYITAMLHIMNSGGGPPSDAS